jgi:hypothetical protein
MLDSEKEIIFKAVHEIHCSDGDYQKGIHMLCELIGLKKPYIISDGVHQVDLTGLKLGNNYFDNN